MKPWTFTSPIKRRSPEALGRRKRQRIGASLAPALIAVMAAAVAAEAAAPLSQPSAKRYDIPSQPLSSAIEAFATASGVQVLYDRPRGPQPRSHAVKGIMSPPEALRTLLEGAGLTAHFTDAGDVVLAPVAADAPARAAPGDNLARLRLAPLRVEGSVVLETRTSDLSSTRLYAGMVQNQLRQALSIDPQTAHGNYDAGLDLWIGPSGEIRQAGISKTSGEAKRDADILAVVHRLVMEAPPPQDMAQPIQVAVHSRPRS